MRAKPARASCSTQLSTTDKSWLPSAKRAGASQISAQQRSNSSAGADDKAQNRRMQNLLAPRGRLRGALTSQEIAKYVEYCLKPGKATVHVLQ